MRCDVWWARPAPATPRLLALLDDAERERYGNYRREIDQLRFLTGRTLLRAVAARHLGVEPEAVILDASCYDCGKPHGKPRVVAERAPEVSISHSGDRVALAMVDGVPVGVDVEEIRDAEVDELARITFTAEERAAFGRVPEAGLRAAFFTYWARKEAVVKATGKGMSVPMSTFTLSAHDAPPAVLASETPEVDPATTRMADLDPGPDYRASLAVFGTETPQVTERSADQLVADLG
ncbi:4'-phosphopantetheinyl transferase family protein [Actinophytocola gossypii]|uniref:4'-phosphopantetheinyl transferase superfamily protein n=1 Tax=Actinophytocola gossypii TaxID=2812003 RepID=A0ABT2J4G2_9PSEU|nr:4'-phosphopantetheinyl transferase superfamily protein [Actinophytocola gossypii]MCT2582764.1 4'-phosphopantetheinyl transferase superfamily protein [Actinophytocola gossypii]